MARDFIFKVKKDEANPPVDPTGTRVIFDEEIEELVFLDKYGKIRRGLKQISIPIVFDISEADVKIGNKNIEIDMSLYRKYNLGNFSIVDLIANPFHEESRIKVNQTFIDSFSFIEGGEKITIKIKFSIKVKSDLNLILKVAL